MAASPLAALYEGLAPSALEAPPSNRRDRRGDPGGLLLRPRHRWARAPGGAPGRRGPAASRRRRAQLRQPLLEVDLLAGDARAPAPRAGAAALSLHADRLRELAPRAGARRRG